jgi:bifunctional non-homologous end joining protein LigD
MASPARPAITHPEKVLFPEDGITKGELAAYYQALAPVIVPHIRARPVTMERFPKGIGEEGFLQKNVVRGFPAWLERIEVPKKGGTVNYPLIVDERSLMWVVNQNTITPHVWTSRAPDLQHPDLCIIDLDPSTDDPETLRSAALAVRDLLAEVGMASWVKTSGSKGYHIAIPIHVETGYREVWRFVQRLADTLVARHPDLFTREFAKVDRGDRVLIDIGRNGPGPTFAAVYAVRPRTGAPVSAPCTWTEIEERRVGPRSFTLRTMAARMTEVGDLWSDLSPQALAEASERLHSET